MLTSLTILIFIFIFISIISSIYRFVHKFIVRIFDPRIKFDNDKNKY